MTTLCHAYGLTFSSDVDLPDFAPGGDAADVSIKIGRVDAVLESATQNYGIWQAGPECFQIEVPEAGRYLIRSGTEIIIDPFPHATDVDLRAFLRSSAIAALLHQRGLILIHASVVDGPTGALFFFGKSGDGKSTTAAAIERRGYRIVSDDVLAMQIKAGTLQIAPGPSSLWLWPDAGDVLGLADRDLHDTRPGTGKFRVQKHSSKQTPHQIRAGFRLCPGNFDTVSVERLDKIQAFEHLWDYTFRRQYAVAMGLKAQVFRGASTLAARAPVFDVSRPVKTFDLEALLDCIEASAAEGS